MEDARDVLQETFLKCWKHRQQIHQIDHLRGWIFRIAVNTARDRRKSAWQRKHRSLDDSPEPPQADSASSDRVNQEQQHQLRIAIAELREQDREVFLFRQNGQMTL